MLHDGTGGSAQLCSATLGWLEGVATYSRFTMSNSDYTLYTAITHVTTALIGTLSPVLNVTGIIDSRKLSIPECSGTLPLVCDCKVQCAKRD